MARQFAHQVFGVKPVGTLAVRGDVSRRRGVGEQAADRRIELRQSFLLRFVAAAKGIVATGIEDDDVGLVPGGAELAQQQAEINAALLHVFLLFDDGIHRQQVVAPFQLGAVPRIVKNDLPDIGTLGGGTEALDRGGHVLARGIEQRIDRESGLREQCRHRLGIVDRIAQG